MVIFQLIVDYLRSDLAVEIVSFLAECQGLIVGLLLLDVESWETGLSPLPLVCGVYDLVDLKNLGDWIVSSSTGARGL